MSIIEWGVIIGISITLILIFFTIYFFIAMLSQTKKLAGIPSSPPKNSKLKKRWRVVRKRIYLKRKKDVKMVVFFSFLALLFGGGTAYLSYYQSTNLSTEDSDLVVRSYLLLRDFEGKINDAANATEEADTVNRDIRYLATNLASYASKTASSANTADGQTVLNRYYAALGELGMNASRQVTEFYNNSELVVTYEGDIDRLKELESKAFDYYSVNQEALENEASENSDGE
ncbi:hypothetical protein ACYSNU_11010 [Enterococcus sp. LJL120]